MIGQPINLIKNYVDVVDKVITAVDRTNEGSSSEPVDSICNSCRYTPHGHPYRRVDTNGNPIDTITPNK